MKKAATTAIIILMIAFALQSFAPKQDPVQASIARGKDLYTTYCLTCHQEDGSGVPKMNPPLIKTSYVTGDKKKLIKWVLSGSTENIPIDGKTYSNNMPPQNYLDDNQVADVLTYVRNSFGNKSGAILPADVKAVRATLKF